MGMDIGAYVEIKPKQFGFAPREAFGELFINEEVPAFRFTRRIRILINEFFDTKGNYEDIILNQDQIESFYNHIKDKSPTIAELLYKINRDDFKLMKEFFRVSLEKGYYVIGG